MAVAGTTGFEANLFITYDSDWFNRVPLKYSFFLFTITKLF